MFVRTRLARIFLLLAAVFSSPLAIESSSWAVETVTFCGQRVEGSAVLISDLDCTNATTAAVILAHKASLDLAGHTISGNPAFAGVGCQGNCRITNGVISGAYDGVRGTGRLVELADLQILGSTNDGVWVPYGKLYANNVVVRNSSNSGVSAKRVQLRGGEVIGGGNNLAGVSAERTVLVEDAAISGSGWWAGVFARKRVKIRRSQITGNAWGATTLANGRGAVFDSTITGNQQGGVWGKAWKVVNSVITGNLADPVPSRCITMAGTVYGCADIIAYHASMRNSECETSISMKESGGSLGICSLD